MSLVIEITNRFRVRMVPAVAGLEPEGVEK